MRKSPLTPTENDLQYMWHEVCETFCRNHNYELVFVNSDNFGYMTPKGQCVHMYAEELKEVIENEKATS